MSQSSWETWYDFDDNGFIRHAEVNAKEGHNVCVTVCDTILPATERETWNAKIIADTELLGAAEMMRDELERCAETLKAVHAEMGPHRETVDCPDIAKRLMFISYVIARTKRQPNPQSLTQGAQ